MVGILTRTQVYPVTQWQRFLLDQEAHPACRDDLRAAWQMASATLVTPRVDMRRLVRALQKLYKRHDSLRLRFSREKGDWRARITPVEEGSIAQIDLGDVDDATFTREIRSIARAPMPLVGGPLAEMVLVKCGDRGDVIVNRIHHALTDGYGMVVIHDDLMKYLLSIPILGGAVSHENYLVRFENPPRRQTSAFDAFWQEMHHDLPRALNAGRKAKGMEPLYESWGEVAYRTLTVTTKKKSATCWKDGIAARGGSEPLAMFSGFLEGVCRRYDADRLAFTTGVSRTDPRLSTYVGHHTLVPVLPYEAVGRRGLGAAETALRERIAEAHSHLPHDAARPGSTWEGRLNARGCYTRQFSALQPTALTREKKSPWSDGLTSGPGVTHRLGQFSFTALDVTAPQRDGRTELSFRMETSGGKLGFKLIHDSIGYDEAEMRGLAETICTLLKLEPASMVLS